MCRVELYRPYRVVHVTVFISDTKANASVVISYGSSLTEVILNP